MNDFLGLAGIGVGKKNPEMIVAQVCNAVLFAQQGGKGIGDN